MCCRHSWAVSSRSGVGVVWSTGSSQTLTKPQHLQAHTLCSSTPPFAPALNPQGRITDSQGAACRLHRVIWHSRNPEIGVGPASGKLFFTTFYTPVSPCCRFLPCSSQIDKIMSSIGAGIGSGLDIKEDAQGEILTWTQNKSWCARTVLLSSNCAQIKIGFLDKMKMQFQSRPVK